MARYWHKINSHSVLLGKTCAKQRNCTLRRKERKERRKLMASQFSWVKWNSSCPEPFNKAQSPFKALSFVDYVSACSVSPAILFFSYLYCVTVYKWLTKHVFDQSTKYRLLHYAVTNDKNWNITFFCASMLLMGALQCRNTLLQNCHELTCSPINPTCFSAFCCHKSAQTMTIVLVTASCPFETFLQSAVFPSVQECQ